MPLQLEGCRRSHESSDCHSEVLIARDGMHEQPCTTSIRCSWSSSRRRHPVLHAERRCRRHSQVFGLERFRETELIHGRWAMLATLGVVVAEGTTGVAWQDAGKVELDGTSYLGLSLPFTVTCVPLRPACA